MIKKRVRLLALDGPRLNIEAIVEIDIGKASIDSTPIRQYYIEVRFSDHWPTVRALSDTVHYSDKWTAKFEAVDGLMRKLRAMGLPKDDRRAIFQAICPEYAKNNRPRGRNISHEVDILLSSTRPYDKANNWREPVSNKEALAWTQDLINQLESNLCKLEHFKSDLLGATSPSCIGSCAPVAELCSET